MTSEIEIRNLRFFSYDPDTEAPSVRFCLYVDGQSKGEWLEFVEPDDLAWHDGNLASNASCLGAPYEEVLEALRDAIERASDSDVCVQYRTNEVVYSAAVSLMDDDLREQIQQELAPCSRQQFMDAYVKAHREKFGEELHVM